MTDQEIANLGPAFASYLRQYRPCFLQDRTASHFDGYCRALQSDPSRQRKGASSRRLPKTKRAEAVR